MGSTPSKKYAEPDRALAASPPSQLERNPSASAPDGGGASPDKGGVSRPGAAAGAACGRRSRRCGRRRRSSTGGCPRCGRTELREAAASLVVSRGASCATRTPSRTPAASSWARAARSSCARPSGARTGPSSPGGAAADVSLAELHRQLSIFELVSKQCVHRNIVKIEGLSFSDDDESLHVMFKIYRGGELLDAIVRSDAPWSEEDARGLAKRLLEALRCCHASGIAHRQVRAENVLLKAENDFAGIALGGWSLATTTDAPADEASVDVVGASLDLQYTAPEVLAARGDGGAPPPGAFATGQDAWALGVLLHALAGHPPLDQERLDEDAMRAAIPAYVFDDGAPWTANVSAGGLAFLKRMLVVDPERRPGAGELLQDAYMRSAVPRATVLDTADLAKFAERRKKKFKRAKTKLKFVVSMIIQANRAKKLTQAIMEGVKKEEAEAAGDAAPAADAAPTTAPRRPSPTPRPTTTSDTRAGTGAASFLADAATGRVALSCGARRAPRRRRHAASRRVNDLLPLIVAAANARGRSARTSAPRTSTRRAGPARPVVALVTRARRRARPPGSRRGRAPRRLRGGRRRARGAGEVVHVVGRFKGSTLLSGTNDFVASTSPAAAARYEFPRARSATRAGPRTSGRSTGSSRASTTFEQTSAAPNLLELYCGCGNHTVALAPATGRTVAVEVDARLTAAAKRNLDRNGVANATIVTDTPRSLRDTALAVLSDNARDLGTDAVDALDVAAASDLLRWIVSKQKLTTSIALVFMRSRHTDIAAALGHLDLVAGVDTYGPGYVPSGGRAF
ncbi:S-adenosylmethionine-dependent tRNA (m5U54) methyltransferase [Aureococcus anophagefferens]|nr:S-adenosylmethionine-dependent tRNA (m5U54) methyltransferase [Aureococcus anophagefferens]